MRFAALLLLASGCAALSGRASDASRQNYRGPPQADRCAAQQGAARQACARARGAALERVRKLYVDDQVCLDGDRSLFEAEGGCHTRAFVESVAPDGVQLEIRQAPEESGFRAMENWWFHESALADVELQSQGF